MIKPLTEGKTKHEKKRCDIHKPDVKPHGQSPETQNKMLLDIPGDMEAIKNTTKQMEKLNELEKEIEKQAEEYLSSKEGVCVGGCEYSYHHNNAIKKAFQDGAKWGIANAIEWHDLRKNLNDLPEDGTEVMFITKNERETLTGTYKNGGGEGTPIFDTFGIAFYDNEQVIAWCELPQFKE